MGNITATEMKRLYFKKSKNKKGQECFIAKVKEYEQEEGKKKQFLGDVIVIANTDKCKIHKSGRWDVEVKEMYGAKGYLVLNADWTVDLLDFEMDWDSYSVRLLANGVETKLKKREKGSEKNKFLPLSFNSEDFYPIQRIADNIREKAVFLQLSPAFDLEQFLGEFTRACEAVHREYKNSLPSQHYSIPNTPMAEMLKNL